MHIAEMPIFGAIPRNVDLAMPSRHLGLVQAEEMPKLETFISTAGAIVAESLDLDTIERVAASLASADGRPDAPAPLGQRIAIASDTAFSFCYPHLKRAWQERGAELTFFSPLADEAPNESADAIYLPGGYPELHASTLSNASNFLKGMASAARRGALIYGECGGYMTLGEGLIDADGARHAMLGLLPVETSFAKRKLTLGYRRLQASGFQMGTSFAAHEFHYSTALTEHGAPLFEATDAEGVPLTPMGRRVGNIMGSYAHIIDVN